MKCWNKEGGYMLSVIVPLIALCFLFSTAASAQKHARQVKGTPAPEKVSPANAKTNEQAAKPMEEGGPEAKKGMEYAACSPDFPGEQIDQLLNFAASLSPDLPNKLKPILMKCDFGVNDQLLGVLERAQEQVAQSQFDNKDQEKRFLHEESEEVEIQLLLAQKPVKEAEVTKLVGDLFDIKQKNMKDEAASLKKQAADLKKRIEERQKLKDQIVARKVKEISSPAPQPAAQAEEEGPPSKPDKLSWD
jgi:hypothetical protein